MAIAWHLTGMPMNVAWPVNLNPTLLPTVPVVFGEQEDYYDYYDYNFDLDEESWGGSCSQEVVAPICSAPSCAVAYQAFFTCALPILLDLDIKCDKPDVRTDTPPRSTPALAYVPLPLAWANHPWR